MSLVGITERGDAGVHLVDWLTTSLLYELDFIIAITKAPYVLLENIELLPTNTIIHATITGYGNTFIEPSVKEYYYEQLDAYDKLVDVLGPERVVLRIDPIIPTDNGIDLAVAISKRCRGRLRISILDYYKHVRTRFERANSKAFKKLNDVYGDNLHLPYNRRRDIILEFPNYVEVCGEPGIMSVGCVSAADYRAFNLPVPLLNVGNQRPSCSCLSNKKELLNHKGQCEHKCLYCYWR